MPRTSLRSTLFVTTLLVPISAYAQSSDESVFLGTLVLSAINEGGAGVSNVEASNTAGSRVPVDVQELPRSLTVVPRAQFEAQGARTLEESASYSPGIATGLYGNDDRYDEFTLRGFEVQSSGTYRDGLSLRLVDFAAWRTEPFALESVNILRGPVSDLYGAAEPGGVVNAVTKRPEFVLGGETQITTKSEGGAELAFDVTGPISDVAAARVIGVLNEFDTNYDEVQTSRKFIAPSLTYEFSPDTSVTVFGQYQEDEVGDVYINVPEYGSFNANANGTWGPNDYTANPDRNSIETKQTYLGYELEHRFSEQLSFVSKARQARNDWDMDTEYAIAFVNLSYLVNPLFGLAPVGNPTDVDTGIMTKFVVDQTAKQNNYENSFHYEFDTARAQGHVAFGLDRLELDSAIKSTLGYTSERNLVTGDVTQFLAGSFPTELNNERAMELEQTGIFVSGHSVIDDTFVLSGGLRADDVMLISDGFNTSLDTSVASFDDTIDDTLYSGNLSFGYRFSPEYMAYASVSNGFNLPLTGVRSDGVALEVEKSKSFEAGLKFASSDGSRAFSLAYFDITKSDVVETDAADTRFVTQIGEMRSRGLEAEGTYDFQNGLSVFGSLTLTDAEITKHQTNQGNKVAGAADVTAAVWATYQPQGIEGLTFGGGARYSGARFSDSANTYEMEAVTLFDASVSYEWDDFVVSAAVRNLADKEYVGYCSANVALFMNAALDAASGGCVYGAGREISLTTKWTF